MAWQLEPPEEAAKELKNIGELQLLNLMADVRSWIDAGEWDDLAIARGVAEKGHSDEFSYWLLKEVRMREIDERPPSGTKEWEMRGTV